MAIAIIATICLGTSAQAQEVRYFNRWNQEVNKAEADHYDVIDVQSDGSAVVKSYTLGDTLVKESHFKDFVQNRSGKWVSHGLFREWHTNGQLKSAVNYQHNKIVGQYTSWYKNGQKHFEKRYVNGELQDTLKGFYDDGALRRLEIYLSGKMMKGEVYAKDGSILPYYPAEEMPEFPGGIPQLMNFIRSNVNYPKAARKAKASGMVVASFIVERDGTIGDIMIVRGVHPDLDAEAVRVVKAMPRWRAGSQEGELVPVRYNLPIRFSL
ncbi:energy transducer TonB [Pontibacter harenae]|uniref:energy transducer TonB n=1 Tax=Pontibacter harenae TaxID=2894083 RepID=UPI001E423F4B|nr:energy transducer TonB [Pontibacter harenae]